MLRLSYDVTSLATDYSLGLHKLLTLQILVTLVSSPHTSTVHTPALLSVVALLGPEFTIILTIGVINAIVVHKGGLNGLSSHTTGVHVFSGSIHFCLHQVAFGDH